VVSVHARRSVQLQSQQTSVGLAGKTTRMMSTSGTIRTVVANVYKTLEFAPNTVWSNLLQEPTTHKGVDSYAPLLLTVGHAKPHDTTSTEYAIM
jgi:hypothetical protein